MNSMYFKNSNYEYPEQMQYDVNALISILMKQDYVVSVRKYDDDIEVMFNPDDEISEAPYWLTLDEISYIIARRKCKSEEL